MRPLRKTCSIPSDQKGKGLGMGAKPLSGAERGWAAADAVSTCVPPAGLAPPPAASARGHRSLTSRSQARALGSHDRQGSHDRGCQQGEGQHRAAAAQGGPWLRCAGSASQKNAGMRHEPAVKQRQAH